MSQHSTADAPPVRTRILHVVPADDSPVRELAAIAIRAQREQRIAAGIAGSEAAIEEIAEAAGADREDLVTVPIKVNALPSPADAAAALALRRVYPFTDIVHAHGQRAGVVASLALTGLPREQRPALVVTVGRGDADSFLHRSRIKLISRSATAILGTTAAITEEAADHVQVARRAPLVRPEIELSAGPDRDPAEVREALGLGEDEWLVVSPIELHDSTALTTVLDAARRIGAARAGRTARVVLTGSGPERRTVEQQFVPRREFPLTLVEPAETLDVLGAADVVIVGEKLSVVSIDDVLALARPLIAIGDERLSAQVGQDAPLVPDDDTDALAAAVNALLDDPVARAKSGQQAKGRVIGSTEPREAAAALLDAYAAVLDAHRADR